MILHIENKMISNNLSQLDIQTEYLTGTNNPVKSFFKPCLARASQYDRAVGYFRSTVYLLIGQDLLQFVQRGGRIRLICSPSMDPSDVKNIESSDKEEALNVTESLIEDFKAILNQDKAKYKAKVLATLISSGALKLRLAMRDTNAGIYHEKTGIFRDENKNNVSFLGSSNESYMGWSQYGNYERIEAFCSWNLGREKERCTKHVNYFETLWKNQMPGVRITKITEEASKYFSEQSFPNLSEINLELLETNEIIPNKVVGRSLYPHQALALENWTLAGKRGILEHATGSGKTFTAINAIKSHIQNNGPVIVLVPSLLLLSQWYAELTEELPEVVLLQVGGGDNRWKNPNLLRAFSDPQNKNDKRLIIATMQSASQNAFITNIIEGEHLLIVVDEVHNIGSPKNSSALKMNCGYRLGLSATPYRYGDQEGTDKIFKYFEKVIEPKYTLKDAIKDERLVKYEYHPTSIHLSEDEMDEWGVYTKKIKLEYARSPKNENGDKIITPRVKLLIIQRSRIAKKAKAKIHYAAKTILANYKPGQRWLVYCEDIDHLNTVRKVLNENDLESYEYHSELEADVKKEILKWFESVGGILVSIRCLDEGVDIPNTTHAVFLASSQNPRQFIQRRGRVLRTYPGKSIAYLYDALVIPINQDAESSALSLLKSEIARAYEFSQHANNKSAGVKLRQMIIDFGIDIDEMEPFGFEEDIDEQE